MYTMSKEHVEIKTTCRQMKTQIYTMSKEHVYIKTTSRQMYTQTKSHEDRCTQCQKNAQTQKLHVDRQKHNVKRTRKDK